MHLIAAHDRDRLIVSALPRDPDETSLVPLVSKMLAPLSAISGAPFAWPKSH
jgi:hypothetical protein